MDRSKRVKLQDQPRPSQVLAMTALVALAYLPLIAHLSPQVSAYVAFLISLRLVAIRWPRLTPGRWFLIPLTLAGVLNVYHAYHTLAGQEGGTALLVTMLALKLLEMHRVRDARLGTILFGFLLTSQFLFDQSPGLAFYLGALLLADIALMADLNARCGPRPALSALGISGRLALQALPLALVLFVLFPRLSAPLWNLGQMQDRAISGVKDWLEPGSVSELVISGELALRARFEGAIPATDTLYWRGPVLWRTDGRRWSPANPGSLPSVAPPLAQADERISYSVVMEPSGQRWLFALDLPLEGPRSSRITGDFQLLADKAIHDPRLYRVVSAQRYRTGELEPEQELAGLALPDNVTPRMKRLVDEWQTQAKDPASLVRLGLDYFHREPFHYTLLPPELGENPADEFLFETRRGFCEHYASSFALLMRIAGIPSRIVLGYLGGEINPIGRHLIVRQSDAHAWVEVWLDEQGWTRVDPTAAVASSRVERSDLLQRLGAGSPLRFRTEGSEMLVSGLHQLRLLADAFDEGWRSWVLGFDSRRQRWMLESVGLGYLREYGLAIAMIIASSVTLGLLTTRLLRRDRRRDPLDRIFAGFCRKLARVGFDRRPDEGPSDFADRVSSARPDLEAQVADFISLYLPLRFGPELGPDRLRELEHRLNHFRPRRT